MDVAKVYNKLSRNKQLSLLETMAGKRQANILAAVLTDANRLQEIYDMSQNSAGSAMQEFEKYQQSITYSIDRLKEEMNGIYTTMVDDQGLKNIIDGFATLTGGVGSFIKTFGAIPTAIGLATTAITLFSSKFKEIVNNGNIPILTKMNKAFDDMRTSILGGADALNKTSTASKDIANAQNANTVATKSYTLATGAATLGTYALQAALTMGLGLAIGGVVKLLSWVADKMVKTKAELKELNSEANQTIMSNAQSIESIEKLSSRYEKLSNTLAVTSDIQQRKQIENELLNIQKELGSVIPELNNVYDKEGQAISTNNLIIKESIKLKQQEMETSAIQMMSANNHFKGLADNLEKAKKKYEEYSDAITHNKGVLEKTNIDSNGVETRDVEMINPDKLAEAQAELKELNDQMNQNIETYQKFKAQGYTDEKLISMGYNVREIEKYTEALKRNAEEKQRNDTIQKNNEGLQALVRQTTTTVEEMKKLRDLQNDVNGSKIFNELANLKFENPSLPAEELRTKVEELCRVLEEEYGITLDVNDVMRLYEGALQDSSLAAKDNADATAELTNSFFNQADTLTKLKKALEEVNSEEGISLGTLQSLSQAYPDIIAHLGSEADLRDFLIGKIHEQDIETQNAYTNMLMSSDSYYQENKHLFADMINKLGEYRGVDLQNCKNLADAKRRIEQALINDLNGAWVNYYTKRYMELGAAAGPVQFDQIGPMNYKPSQAEIDMLNRNKQLADQYKQFANSIKQITVGNSGYGGLIQNSINSASGGGKPSSSGGKKPSGGSSKPSSGKTDAEKAEEEYQRERERLEKEANSNIDKMRNELVSLLKKKYEELRKSELDVTNKEIERLDKEIEKKQKELDRLRNNNMDEKEKIVAMEKELALWKQNSTEYGKEMVKQLEEQLAIAKKEQEIKELENLKEQQKDKQDEINKKYDEMTDDKKLYDEATNIMKNKDYEQIKSLINDFGEAFKDSAMLFGKTVSDIINDTVNDLKGSIDFLGGLGKGFATGGYTGDWSSNNGRIALVHPGEQILSKVQTKDFHRLVNNLADYNKIFDYMKMNPGNQYASSIMSEQFNKLKPPKVEMIYNNEVNINNTNTINTPWDERKFNDNIGKQMTKELSKMGIKK